MPCDTRSESELDLKKFNGPVFLAALTALGLNPRHNFYKTYTFEGGSFNSETGEFTFRTSAMAGTKGSAPERIAEIRRAYSAQVLTMQAKRNGWTLTSTAKNQYVMSKR